MSAEDCPFTLIRPETSNEEHKSDSFIKFEIPIDPDDPDGLKSNIQFLKLASDDPEDVLTHFRNFEKLTSDLGTAEGAPMFRLFQLTLSADAEADWNTVLEEIGDDRDPEDFMNAKDLFLISKVERDCALNTKEWMGQIKKPRAMTVKKFMQRIKQINNLFPYMPLPEEGAEEEDRINGFSEAELRNVLRKAGPRDWKDTQDKSNIRFDSTAAQVQYYEKLRNIDEKKLARNKSKNSNHNNNNKNNNRKQGNRNNGNGKNYDPNAPCPIHGPSHTVGDCKIIQQEKSRYTGKKKNNSNGNNHGSGNGSNNNGPRNHRYNTRSQRREENNATETSNNKPKDNDSDSEDNYAIEEELNVLSEEQVHDSVKQADSAIQSNQAPSNCSSSTLPKGTDVRVSIPLINDQPKKYKNIIGLFDTGATNTFVQRHVLRGVEYTTNQVNVSVKGRYSSTSIKEQATFNLKLPDFAPSKSITVHALIEDSAKVVGRHDIVFGSTFLQELGITFDYGRGTIVWDDVSTSMKTITQVEINSIDDDDDPADKDLPAFMKSATKRATSTIKPNIYSKYNYRDMVLRCEHLDKSQQDALISLFSEFEELFSGQLGKVPGPPVSLKLKPNSKPYCARAYTVPKALEHIARKEVQDLVDIGVLVKGVHSAWASPSFFRPKKDGRVRFVSDLRRLNACLERHPYPLPLIEEVIWKMNGFTFATCLDLNRGYYHFVLDDESKKLCGIVLPWGRYSYARLPQGLMPSSDIFQSYMMDIFGAFEDIIVYIDNIILFTKGTFDNHLLRLRAVLKQLHKHNLHVHVEETFLASDRVDYLGYTLTTEGIRPQIKKILPILRFSKPTTVKQLRGFLGLVNYYKKLYHHRSHILEPLTRISSSKTKFRTQWGPDQDAAFSTVKQLIARQVLLHFPDFTKPFDVFTDASDYQLGGVIVQDNFPVAFYSRKLNSAQRNYTTMEKELLSIVETAVHHRGILFGFHICFHSDHKNLSFDNFQSERVRRWRLLLEEFDYEFKYTPGKDNMVADMISRYPIIQVNEKTVEHMNNVEEDPEFPLCFDTISNHQSSDQQLQQRMKQHPESYAERFVHNISLVFYKDKVAIPTTLVHPIIQWYHDNLNHPGITRTFETINMHFTYKGLKDLVKQHVSSCAICIKQKTATKKYGHLPPTTAQYRPWECVHIDLFGPWSFQCLHGKNHQICAVSIIDSGLRWVELHEYSSKTSEDISLIFDREWLCRYPRPRMVVFDNGTEFTSEFHELLESYGIQPKSTTIKNPQTNAVVERVHQTIGDSLRAMNLATRPVDTSSIHGILQSIAWGLRTTFHTALRTSPGQLTFGQDMVIPATYLANWRHIHTRRQKAILYDNARENRSRIDHDYAVGDYVYILTKDIQRKLAPIKQGPFVIVRVHTNATVTIQRSRRVTERVNIRRLFPAHV